MAEEAGMESPNSGSSPLLFFQGDEEPDVAYANRKGKYQD